MQCEICKKNKATMQFKQICNGVFKNAHICEECAEESGFNLESPVSFADFLFGTDLNNGILSTENEQVCPVCRFRKSDFNKSSRLGCPVCYDTFIEDLKPLLTAMHKSCKHIGKVPVGQRAVAELTALKQKQEKAIMMQDFEEAARLRDVINSMKSDLPQCIKVKNGSNP